MFHRLLRVTEDPARLVILPHDNPDPDALASAAALQFLINRAQEDKDIVIALGGIVGRAENRAMLRYLNIKLVPIGEIDFASKPQIALVDTQPGRRNNSLPENVVPTIVIDHHPAYGTYEGVPFLDLRDHYGATSTILTEYIKETRVDVESKLATALFYGINAETQDLGREATPKDIAACQFLYPYTNKRRLAKIENARVPREYFKVFRDALEEAVLYDKVVISVLHEVQYPDMVAEVADFLLRLDEADWSMAIGHYHDSLYVSLRTVVRDVNAGEILQKVLGSSSAGGHDMIAGGRITVSTKGVAVEKAAVKIKDRLLHILGVAASSAHDLVQ
ncbi:MAG: bifunctional oligoribonuclease/PAP phosphatase NrnA [Candidatus Binatia bacterium]